MSQLDLPLGLSPGAVTDFLVGEANRDAVTQLDFWPAWPVRAALLVGPRRSGRSLLGRLFAQRTGATVLDDADMGDERALFHAWNAAQTGETPLLLIAQAPPPAWQVALPDLRSRLAATPVLRIHEPDDALFRALILRGLDRHALIAAPDAIDWLVRRADRSYAMADRIIDTVNRQLAGQRRVSIAVARAALGSIEGEP